VCPSCGENYHIEFRPPERNGECDSCGDKLIQRLDDEKDTILNRLRVFSEYTKPVLEYYNDREGFTKIEGRDGPEDVWESIRKIF
jgi:adenylate kinase